MVYNLVQAPANTFERYLYSYTVTQFSEDVNCAPINLTAEQTTEFGVLPLKLVTPPAYDRQTQELVLLPAQLVDSQWTQIWEVVNLSPEQIAIIAEQTAQENKTQASSLLTATDWTSIPAVADPLRSNPYLTNQGEFDAYRSQLREIAINPPTTPAVFPPMPQEVWSS
jgi:hypothetical protein